MRRFGKSLFGLGARLRLSNAECKRLAAGAKRLPSVPDDLRPLAFRLGADIVRDRVLLSAADADAVRLALASLDGWSPPRMPLSGRDLIALGVPEGPAVSAALRRIEDAWVAAGFPAEPAAVLALAQAAGVAVK